MPTIAIYARKSKFVSRSESVSTQVSLCREHCARLFPDAEYIIYDSDEGYSGKNTDRPGFQQLLADIKARKVDVVCAYRLDRISRSVADFCQLVDLFQRYHISFVSLRENVDTSTPMGRAMVYMTSVFSQLERETLAERVRDNVYELAKSGRWLGGTAPTGFTSIEQPGANGKNHVALSPIEDELAIVRAVYRLYEQLGSLTKVETHCLLHNITSRNGISFSRTTLRALLTNPVYCAADAASLAYFSAQPCELCVTAADADGTHALMPFNRTSKSSTTTINKPIDEWIIAVGSHPATIPGTQWVHVQQMLAQNRDLGRTYKSAPTESALLSGILRCAHCGAAMRPKTYGKPLPDGSRRFSYVCSTKDATGSAHCTMKNAPGIDIDALVISHLAQLSSTFDPTSSEDSLIAPRAAADIQQQISKLEKEILAIQRKIDNLVNAIASGAPPEIHAQLYAQISAFTQEIDKTKASIAELNAAAMDANGQQDLIEMVRKLFSHFDDTFAQQTYDEKRRLIRSVVDSVVWDGENATINVLGASTLPK